MTPARGLVALLVAFTAGLTLTLVVVDSSGDGLGDAQRIETAGAFTATESSSFEQITPSLTTSSNPGLLVVATVGDGANNDADAKQTIQIDPASLVAATAGQTTSPEALIADGVSIVAAPTSEAPSTQTSAKSEPAGAGDAGPTETIIGRPYPQPSTNPTPAPAAPTTGPAPSTGAPSTGAPPTAAPSTAAPSTAAPSTAAPSTAAPSTAAPSTAAPTTAAPTTAAPTTAAPTTAAPTTAAPTTAAPRPAPASEFDSIRNRDPLFNRYENVPANQINIDNLLQPAPVPDNGSNGDGNFRMACNYSHFSYDDPIVFPNQPGKSHLHMFFGNTGVDAYTDKNSLMNSGGGSCNGFELNRSGYWTPAMLDGKGNAVVPDQIILYYKTKDPSTVKGLPEGLKMIAGNATKESFTADYKLGWSCGASGTSYNRSNRIPNNCGNDPINAYIQFPFCWDGKNLDSADHISHLVYINDNQSCPGSHPVRLPQITILMYFPAGNTSGWHLSSDKSGGFNTGPGATLHADWFGGWHPEALDLWMNGCMVRARNCSFGQTGTNRMFQKLNNHQNYTGNNFLPLP